MFCSANFFFLLCLCASFVLPVLAELKSGQEHVCTKISFTTFKDNLEKCPNIETEFDLYEECRRNWIKEWKTLVCCEGYVEADNKCIPYCSESECVHGHCYAPGKCGFCSINFGGPHCDQPCKPKHFAAECEKSCDCILDKSCNINYRDDKYCLCNQPNGIPFECKDICNCRHPCPSGWLGKNCSLPCPENTYGTLCFHNCTCLLENTVKCNPENGFCTCKERFYGVNCESYCDQEHVLVCSNESTLDCQCVWILEQKYAQLNKVVERLGSRIEDLAESVDESAKATEKKKRIEKIQLALDKNSGLVGELDSKLKSLTESVDESTSGKEKQARISKIIENYKELKDLVEGLDSRLKNLTESVDESTTGNDKRSRIERIQLALEQYNGLDKVVEDHGSKIESLTRNVDESLDADGKRTRMEKIWTTLNSIRSDMQRLKVDQDYHLLAIILIVLFMFCFLFYLVYRIVRRLIRLRSRSKPSKSIPMSHLKPNETFGNPIYNEPLLPNIELPLLPDSELPFLPDGELPISPRDVRKDETQDSSGQSKLLDPFRSSNEFKNSTEATQRASLPNESENAPRNDESENLARDDVSRNSVENESKDSNIYEIPFRNEQRPKSQENIEMP